MKTYMLDTFEEGLESHNIDVCLILDEKDIYVYTEIKDKEAMFVREVKGKKNNKDLFTIGAAREYGLLNEDCIKKLDDKTLLPVTPLVGRYMSKDLQEKLYKEHFMAKLKSDYEKFNDGMITKDALFAIMYKSMEDIIKMYGELKAKKTML